jgi:hypothetical protein
MREALQHRGDIVALNRYPTLNKMLDELTELNVREVSRKREDRGKGVSLSEGRDVLQVCVPWVGEFLLSGPQREVVRQLLHAMTHCRNPEMDERTLLSRAGVKSGRLSDLFAKNKAWDTLIIRGSSPTSYRIAPPPDGWDADPDELTLCDE